MLPSRHRSMPLREKRGKRPEVRAVALSLMRAFIRSNDADARAE